MFTGCIYLDVGKSMSIIWRWTRNWNLSFNTQIPCNQFINHTLDKSDQMMLLASIS